MISEFFFKSTGGCPEILRDMESPDAVKRKSVPQRLFSVGFWWGVVIGVLVSPGVRWFLSGWQAGNREYFGP
jgi:hypothetical protein